MPPADEFELGVVTVEVTTLDGSTTIEDWDPAEAPEAREYAAETANCADVASTIFRDNRTGEEITYGATAIPKGEA